MAERQQGLLPANGRPYVRRRAAEPGTSPVGGRQPQFCRSGDRYDPLRQNCPRPGPWRTDPRARRLFLQARSEEHTSELQSLMRISYAVFCLKKKKKQIK